MCNYYLFLLNLEVIPQPFQSGVQQLAQLVLFKNSMHLRVCHSQLQSNDLETKNA